MQNYRVVENAKDQKEDIRKLHIKETRDGVSFCLACVDHQKNWRDDYQEWPCETMRALQADDEWNKISEVVRYLDDL